MRRPYWLLLIPMAGLTQPLTVGSKAFTESVILGEIARVVAPENLAVSHRRELGGSRILFDALERGDIDVYPDYTGTLVQELLQLSDPAQLATALDRRGLAMTEPLGFNNTYAISMLRDRAGDLGIRRISDLSGHPELVLGFSNEFMDRSDGWPGLRNHYSLGHDDVRGLSHDLAYRGLAAGDIDVIDAYSTDADIDYYDLVVLEDDYRYFPAYHAVFVYRQDLAERAPQWVSALQSLSGRISDGTMVSLNARVKIKRQSETEAAVSLTGTKGPIESESLVSRVIRRTGEHLILVGLSLSIAILIAIPAGVLADRRPRIGQMMLSTAGVLQTIPSLALLVMLIPLLGIGAGPAIVALIVYSILPILRNTHAGLTGIPADLRESALALGLSSTYRLQRLELPLARGTILAGIKTAAVINVGTATLGALIGAGGYGQPILTGIRLDDSGLILEGAVPAAVMALTFQWSFDALERLADAPSSLRN